MSLHTYYVRASILRGFQEFLEKNDVSPHQIVADVGLTADDLLQSERELPFESVALLLEKAAYIAQDPNLGLTYAKAYPVGGTGLLAFLFLNSSTVEDALRTLVRYVPLLRAPLKFSYTVVEGGAQLQWRAIDGLTVDYQQIYVFSAALLMLRLRLLLPDDWHPLKVELQSPRPSQPHDFFAVFGANISFGMPHNCIEVDSETLARAVPQAKPELRALLERYGESEIAGLLKPDDTLIEATRQSILRSLGERRISLEDVATELNYTPRRLQSHLAMLSTTFEEVLNEARRLRAEQLLKSEISLTEIALQLGFSELSAFTRAAQRWFNRSPSAQRQYLKGPQLVQGPRG